MKIAFIGLGIMGKPMAKNLLKAGHELRVYDRNTATLEEMKAAGATVCGSSSETVEGVDLVLTMLPNSPHVKSVMLEDDKLAEKMPKTAAFIDMSSINPVASREIAAELEKRGIQMLDAPVSGGQPKAIDGTLSFMVGGKQELFDKFKPVLEAMGSSVVLCGDVGAGNVTKLCNQTIVAVNIAALAEALQMGQMCGVEPEKIFQAIKGGLAGSTVMNASVPSMAFGSPPDTGQSSISMPSFANSAAISREAMGLMEEQSSTIFPAVMVFAAPASPNRASFTLGELGTIVITMSHFSPTSMLLAAAFAPAATTSSTALGANLSATSTS